MQPDTTVTAQHVVLTCHAVDGCRAHNAPRLVSAPQCTHVELVRVSIHLVHSNTQSSTSRQQEASTQSKCAAGMPESRQDRLLADMMMQRDTHNRAAPTHSLLHSCASPQSQKHVCSPVRLRQLAACLPACPYPAHKVTRCLPGNISWAHLNHLALSEKKLAFSAKYISPTPTCSTPIPGPAPYPGPRPCPPPAGRRPQ